MPAELAQLKRMAGPVLRVLLAVTRRGFARREEVIFPAAEPVR